MSGLLPVLGGGGGAAALQLAAGGLSGILAMVALIATDVTPVHAEGESDGRADRPGDLEAHDEAHCGPYRNPDSHRRANAECRPGVHDTTDGSPHHDRVDRRGLFRILSLCAWRSPDHGRRG